MDEEVLLDYRITSIDLQVLKAMEPYAAAPISPALSSYTEQATQTLIANGRDQLRAAMCGRRESGIYFGTYADILATLFEALYTNRILRSGATRILVSPCESPTLYRRLALLRAHGAEIETLPLRPNGSLDLDRLMLTLQDDVAWVSVTMVDPVSGVIMPTEEIGRLCRKYGVPFHSDATYAVGKIPIDMQRESIDCITLCGSGFGAPGHGGALIADSASGLPKLLGYRRGWLKEGPVDSAMIAGLAKGVEVANDMLGFEVADIKHMRDMLEASLGALGNVVLVGKGASRIPHTVAWYIPDLSGETVQSLLAGRHIYVASGSSLWRSNPYRVPLLEALGSPSQRHALISMTLHEAIDETSLEPIAPLVRNTLLPWRYSKESS